MAGVEVEADEDDDVDVIAERNRVLAGEAMEDPDTVLCVDGLRKVPGLGLH